MVLESAGWPYQPAGTEGNAGWFDQPHQDVVSGLFGQGRSLKGVVAHWCMISVHGAIQCIGGVVAGSVKIRWIATRDWMTEWVYLPKNTLHIVPGISFGYMIGLDGRFMKAVCRGRGVVRKICYLFYSPFVSTWYIYCNHVYRNIWL